MAEQAWHSWTLMGGCMEPLGCSICGIEGEVPGPARGDTKPKSCIICGQTAYNQAHPEDFRNYNIILKNFLEDGHPDITSIDSISLEWVDEFIMFDTRSCDVIATFTSNGETFKCYLSGTSSSAEGAYYTVLDLDRIE